MREVLVVDDDPFVCGLVCELLSCENFAVTCAQTDSEAYAVLTTDKPLAALVLDVNLGAGTTGFDIARLARQTRPVLPIIYISGEASPTNHLVFGVPNSRFLSKPFTAQDLIDLLRREAAAT